MLVTKRSSQIGQSSIERKTFNRELGFGIILLIILSVCSMVLTEKPAMEDVSRAFITKIPEELQANYIAMMNDLLASDPSLASDVTRWSHELHGLVTHYEKTL